MVITCDTEISELINPNDVIAKLNGLHDDIKSILTYSKILEKESSLGNGLSVESFKIDGKSYLNEEAIKQLRILEGFNSTYNSAKSEMIEAAEEQRKKEVRILQLALETKISELNAAMLNAKAQLNPITSALNPPTIISRTKIEADITSYQNLLNHYENKLRSVEKEVFYG